MNRLNIDDEVKIFMPGFRANGKVVRVESIQKLTDNTILYTGSCTEEACVKGLFGEFIQFKEDQYKVINHEGNDFVSEKNDLSIILKFQNVSDIKDVLEELKAEIEKRVTYS